MRTAPHIREPTCRRGDGAELCKAYSEGPLKLTEDNVVRVIVASGEVSGTVLTDGAGQPRKNVIVLDGQATEDLLGLLAHRVLLKQAEAVPAKQAEAGPAKAK